MVDKGGVDPLITLLNDVKPSVQANAAVCLTNLATEGKTNVIPFYCREHINNYFFDFMAK